MNNKVYVDNLAAVTTERDLMKLFSPYGNVAEVNIAVDRANHKPRGFGFVTMATPEGARAAIQALHGKEIGTAQSHRKRGVAARRAHQIVRWRRSPRRRAQPS